MDFSCGFQLYFSSGRRSMNLRVMGAWISNSASSDCAIDIGFSFVRGNGNLLNRRFGSAELGALLYAFVNVSPAGVHTGSEFGLYQAETGVAELDHRDAVFFAEPILHVVGDRVRH